MHEVISVKTLDDFYILVEFENGEKRIKDIKPLIKRGGIWDILKNKSIFNNVYIVYGAVTWKDNNGNEIDICSDKLYMDSIPYNKECCY